MPHRIMRLQQHEGDFPENSDVVVIDMQRKISYTRDEDGNLNSLCFHPDYMAEQQKRFRDTLDDVKATTERQNRIFKAACLFIFALTFYLFIS